MPITSLYLDPFIIFFAAQHYTQWSTRSCTCYIAQLSQFCLLVSNVITENSQIISSPTEGMVETGLYDNKNKDKIIDDHM